LERLSCWSCLDFARHVHTVTEAVLEISLEGTFKTRTSRAKSRDALQKDHVTGHASTPRKRCFLRSTATPLRGTCWRLLIVTGAFRKTRLRHARPERSRGMRFGQITLAGHASSPRKPCFLRSTAAPLLGTCARLLITGSFQEGTFKTRTSRAKSRDEY
jgi:hypothetical protein